MSRPIPRTGLTSVLSERAAQVNPIASAAKVAMFDDFLGDVLADEWNYVEGTDTATAAGAVLAGGVGGVLRLTTGDAGTGLDADLAQVTSYLNWAAENGGLMMEARVKLSAITDAYLFVGFTDVTTLEAPIVSAASANTLTTNATDAVGFMFDTRMTADTLWLVGVADDVDATAVNSAVALVADTYVTLRVEVDTDGSAKFYINGALVGTTALEGAVTADVALTPTVAAGNTANTTGKTCDIDYIVTSMSR